jgi:hypothetical protein
MPLDASYIAGAIYIISLFPFKLKVNAMLYTPNGKLYFQDSSGSPTEFDPVTGEPIFTSAESVVDVSIEDLSSWLESAMSGANEHGNKLMGRCVNPRSLTPSQRRQRKARIELNIGEEIITGDVSLTPSIASRLQLDKYFGERIEASVTLSNLEPLSNYA